MVRFSGKCVGNVVFFELSNPAFSKPDLKFCGFIDFNTQMRTKATADFERDLFKLLNNAVLEKQWRTYVQGVIFKFSR